MASLTEEDRILISALRSQTWLNVKYGKWKFGKTLEALDALRDYALAEENDTELGEMDMREMRKKALALCPPVTDPDKAIWDSFNAPKQKRQKGRK